MGNVFNIAALGASIANAKDKALGKVGEYGLTQALDGRVLPPMPIFPVGKNQALDSPKGFNEVYNVEALEAQGELRYSIFGSPMCFPVAIRTAKGDDDWWWLPIEPIITMSGGNTIVKRNVAKVSNANYKKRGSIKEMWSNDDYKIDIVGLLSKFDEWAYPTEDVRRLRSLLESRSALFIKCELLEIFGIGKIVVENWDIPFTKGEENQAYSIKAISDDEWDLLIKK
jgi:hypothetical protein